VTIRTVAVSLPEHYYSQDELFRELSAHWGPKVFNPGRLEAFHRNVGVAGRHLRSRAPDHDRQGKAGGSVAAASKPARHRATARKAR